MVLITMTKSKMRRTGGKGYERRQEGGEERREILPALRLLADDVQHTFLFEKPILFVNIFNT